MSHSTCVITGKLYFFNNSINSCGISFGAIPLPIPCNLIAMGFIFFISSQPYRINRKNYEGEYLELLKQNIPIEQLVFDVDYNWNINPHTNQIDNEAVKRVKKVWQDKKEQERIFCKNILEFYKNRNVEFKSDIKERGEER